MLHSLTMGSVMILADAPAWVSSAWSIAQVILGFSLIVFVHEMGHFLAAKWAGVRVERFAVGFGREMFGFTKGETRYSFNILPLGGYVKMLGQEDFVVDKSGELKVKSDPDAFTNKPVSKRMVIVTAGVIMNLIFAAVAFTIVAMVGRWQPPPVIGYVRENSPAGRAGLQPGDRIEEINGDSIASFNQLSGRIALSDSDETLDMVVWRDGELLEPHPRIVPEFVKEEQIRQIGVGPARQKRVWFPSFQGANPSVTDLLRQHDEIHKVKIDGAFQDVEGLGTVLRAMMRAQGEPIEAIVKRPKDPDALTDEQLRKYDAEIESTEETVRLRALWMPAAYQMENRVTASMLGLVPRMTVLQPAEGKSFAEAGVQIGDVIVRIGNIDSPSYAELKRLIEDESVESVAIKVRRPWEANRGLSESVVSLCSENREEIIAAAFQDLSKAMAVVYRLATQFDLSESDQEGLIERLRKLDDASAWRVWFEQVDVHTLASIKPKAPFALFESPSRSIDADLRCIDENHLVVADIVKKFGDRPTPAHIANIPRGAVIITANGKPVGQWHHLTAIMMANAGKSIEIKYRLADAYHTTTMMIPGSPQTALGMGPEDRIVKIDGKSTYTEKRKDGNERRLALPDWRAVKGLLKASVGKSVEIVIDPANGEHRTAPYAVTENNVDPWPDRVTYQPMIQCYPLLEKRSISNPAVAFVTGVEEAYRATVQTVQSIRHMVFTRKVGLKKVSGPVGILRVGAKVAEAGPIELLWLMGLLSANLAVINFLPLPIVDGGLFLFLILEKIRGEPVSIKTQVATQLIGIALIASIFVLVTYQDVLKWFTGT